MALAVISLSALSVAMVIASTHQGEIGVRSIPRGFFWIWAAAVAMVGLQILLLWNSQGAITKVTCALVLFQALCASIAMLAMPSMPFNNFHGYVDFVFHSSFAASIVQNGHLGAEPFIDTVYSRAPAYHLLGGTLHLIAGLSLDDGLATAGLFSQIGVALLFAAWFVWAVLRTLRPAKFASFMLIVAGVVVLSTSSRWYLTWATMLSGNSFGIGPLFAALTLLFLLFTNSQRGNRILTGEAISFIVIVVGLIISHLGAAVAFLVLGGILVTVMRNADGNRAGWGLFLFLGAATLTLGWHTLWGGRVFDNLLLVEASLFKARVLGEASSIPIDFRTSALTAHTPWPLRILESADLIIVGVALVLSLVWILREVTKGKGLRISLIISAWSIISVFAFGLRVVAPALVDFGLLARWSGYGFPAIASAILVAGSTALRAGGRLKRLLLPSSTVILVFLAALASASSVAPDSHPLRADATGLTTKNFLASEDHSARWAAAHINTFTTHTDVYMQALIQLRYAGSSTVMNQDDLRTRIGAPVLLRLIEIEERGIEGIDMEGRSVLFRPDTSILSDSSNRVYSSATATIHFPVVR